MFADGLIELLLRLTCRGLGCGQFVHQHRAMGASSRTCSLFAPSDARFAAYIAVAADTTACPSRSRSAHCTLGGTAFGDI
jgi:hypothetical protein